MAIKHKFASAVADGTDTTQVRSSNWNDDHFHVPFVVYCVWDTSSGFTVTNASATGAEWRSPVLRQKVDLTYANEARLLISLSGTVNSTLKTRIDYSTDNGTSWVTTAGILVATPATGPSTGEWVALPAGMKADVLLRPFYHDGDGVADPNLVGVVLQVR